MSAPGVKIDHTSKAVVIQPDTNSTGHAKLLKFPFVWLRDNCQCEKCFHPVSKARLFLMRHLDPKIVPKETQTTAKGEISVIWPDDHQSVYDLEWLKERHFSPDDCKRRLGQLSRPLRLWNAQFQNNILKIDYSELMSSDKTLYQWLVDMEEVGLTLITGAPTQTGVVKTIGDRVAFLKTTNYGQSFTVKSKVDPCNLAYTSATLGLHSDLPQYHYTPGVQMLHCIAQVATEGGDNIFSDAFYTAEVLQREYPNYYKTLTTVDVDFYDVGTDIYKFHFMMRVPVIEVDGCGKPTKVNYSNQSRDSILNACFEDVQPLYEAMCKMEELLNDRKHCINFKLKEGDIVCFHNYRVLHGRNAFKLPKGGERHLEGGYLDWDEIKSRRRVLQEELGDEV